MVRLTAEFKRGFLNSLFIQAKGSSTSLTDALNTFLVNSFSSVQTGRLVVSHAGAGKSTVFQIPRIDQYCSQEEVFSLAQELTEVYTDAVVTIENNPPVISTAQLTGNCFTDGTGSTFSVTTTVSHGLRSGSIVFIASPQIPLFLGEFSVTVTSTTVFTCPIAQQNQPVTANGLTVSVVSISPDLSDGNIFATMMLDDRLQDINRVCPDFTTLLMWPR